MKINHGNDDGPTKGRLRWLAILLPVAMLSAGLVFTLVDDTPIADADGRHGVCVPFGSTHAQQCQHLPDPTPAPTPDCYRDASVPGCGRPSTTPQPTPEPTPEPTPPPCTGLFCGMTQAEICAAAGLPVHSSGTGCGSAPPPDDNDDSGPDCQRDPTVPGCGAYSAPDDDDDEDDEDDSGPDCQRDPTVPGCGAYSAPDNDDDTEDDTETETEDDTETEDESDTEDEGETTETEDDTETETEEDDDTEDDTEDDTDNDSSQDGRGLDDDPGTPKTQDDDTGDDTTGNDGRGHDDDPGDPTGDDELEACPAGAHEPPLPTTTTRPGSNEEVKIATEEQVRQDPDMKLYAVYWERLDTPRACYRLVYPETVVHPPVDVIGAITKVVVNGIEYVVKGGKTVIDGVEYVVKEGALYIEVAADYVASGAEIAARSVADAAITALDAAESFVCSYTGAVATTIVTAAGGILLAQTSTVATIAAAVGASAALTATVIATVVAVAIISYCEFFASPASPQTAALVTAVPAPSNVVAQCLNAGEFVVAVVFDQVVDPESREVLYLVEGIEATPQVIKGSPYTSFDTFTGESTSVRLEVLFSGASGASYSITMKTRIGDQDSEASEAVSVACPAA